MHVGNSNGIVVVGRPASFLEPVALHDIGILIVLSAHFTDEKTEAKGQCGGNELRGLPGSHGE